MVPRAPANGPPQHNVPAVVRVAGDDGDRERGYDATHAVLGGRIGSVLPAIVGAPGQCLVVFTVLLDAGLQSGVRFTWA